MGDPGVVPLGQHLIEGLPVKVVSQDKAARFIGQVGLHPDDGLVVGKPLAVEIDGLGARGQLHKLRHLGLQLHQLEIQYLGAGGTAGAAYVVVKGLDALNEALYQLGVGHKGALALDAVQVLLPHQVGDGLAHGGTADAEHLAELHFGGNHAPHRVISVVDLLQDQLFKLEIQGNRHILIQSLVFQHGTIPSSLFTVIALTRLDCCNIYTL